MRFLRTRLKAKTLGLAATIVHRKCLALSYETPMRNRSTKFHMHCVGGGGLLLGIAQGLREVGWAKTDVLVSETVGCDSLFQSVQKNELVTLPAITSVADPPARHKSPQPPSI